IIKEIYEVGLPSIIMQSIGSVMTIGMNTILITFSATAVAVFGIYFKLQSFIFLPVFGLTAAMISIVGFNYGARNKERVARAIRHALLIAVGVMILGLLIFQTMPTLLLRLFDASPSMLTIGTRALRIISIHFPLAGVAIILSSSFQAIGKGLYSLVLSIVRQLGVLLPAAYLLARLWGLDAVWFTFFASEVVSLTLAIIFFVRIYRREIATLEQPLIPNQG
ncbi:MAG: MATE family efflux transporter, partial [Spirochaetales bacterium]|nr:MATE family efflux transporter [Spirochaetales bacterium]